LVAIRALELKGKRNGRKVYFWGKLLRRNLW